MTVRFSIAIPVWNDKDWLPGAIESVLAQTHNDWEINVSDNASDVDLQSIVAQYKDSRIRHHRFERHTDIYENFNRALHLGSFEWVHPISADDRLDHECLAKIAERIEQLSSQGVRVAAVATDSARVDPEGNPAYGAFAGHQRVAPIPDGTYNANEWLDIMAMPRQAPWNIGSISFSREVIVESGGFRPDVGYGADLELVLRVAAYGSVSYINEKLFLYTVREVSDSLGRSLETLTYPMTPMHAAWVSALGAHTMSGPLPSEQRARISDTIARSHIQRALQQRLWSRDAARRNATRDVGRALSLHPRLFLSPTRMGAALLAVAAPKWAVSMALRRLAIHRRGAQEAASQWRV